jgi:Domain of unknown function (DUF4954)
MNKAQAKLEFARIAQERQCQIARIHQVFSFAHCPGGGGGGGGSSSSSSSAMMMNVADNHGGSGGNIPAPAPAPALLRELNASEIQVLESNGCHCSDWSLLRLGGVCRKTTTPGACSMMLPTTINRKNSRVKYVDQEGERDATSLLLRRFVTHTTFAGRVVLMFEPIHHHHHHHYPQESTTTTTTTNHNWTNYAQLPYGIHFNGVICDCILASVNTSRIWHNTIVSNSYIAPQAVVLRCGVIRTNTSTTTTTTATANNRVLADGATTCNSNIHHDEPPLALTVGPESGGGRPLRLSAQATMIEVQEQLQFQHQLQQQNSCSSSSSSSSSIFDWNVVGQQAILRDTATVESIYMHANSIIEGAASVQHTILFPQATIRGAASTTVSHVRLQWKACIQSQSCISNTLLMECAEAGPHSIVTNTVLGPDTHVSAGEVHGSVLGPNTNAHHQSLVIGLLWPHGRGNVGYGANVGSNHTGRLPDQECCAGEGTFWGLSCVVVFPVNLLDAPYSIVAAGTTLKSQQLPCLPFSLLVNDNALIPAWVLTSSLYTLVRSEMKFANRRKATRHAYYTGWKIMRPEMIDLCRSARGILRRESQSSLSSSTLSLSSLYKWSDKTRQKGIQAYTDCIQRYLLHGLLSFLVQELTSVNDGAFVVTNGSGAPLVQKSIRSVDTLLAHEFSEVVSNNRHYSSSSNANADTSRSPTQWPPSPWDESDDPSSAREWMHQRRLLLEEFPPPESPSPWTVWVGSTLLPKLIHLENEYAERVFQSKARDDVRGKNIIPDYDKSHEPAAKDPVIIHVREMALETKGKVNIILQQIQHENQSRL